MVIGWSKPGGGGIGHAHALLYVPRCFAVTHQEEIIGGAIEAQGKFRIRSTTARDDHIVSGQFTERSSLVPVDDAGDRNAFDRDVRKEVKILIPEPAFLEHLSVMGAGCVRGDPILTGQKGDMVTALRQIKSGFRTDLAAADYDDVLAKLLLMTVYRNGHDHLFAVRTGDVQILLLRPDGDDHRIIALGGNDGGGRFGPQLEGDIGL